MNIVDIAILTLLVAFLVKGLMRGLLKEFCALLGLVGGVLLAFRYQAALAEAAVQTLHLPPALGATVAFLAIFLTTVLFFILLGILLSRFVNLLFLGGLDRVAGGLFALAQGIMLLAVVLFALTLRTTPRFLATSIQRSQLAPPFVQLGEATYHGSSRLFPPRPAG